MSIIFENHTAYPESILIRKFAGVVDIEEILNSWEYLIDNNMIHANLKGVINNISSCDLSIDMDGFKSLIEYLKSTAKLRQIKLAVICTDPNKIIFPILGENIEKELRIKTFSTTEAAEKWIMV